MTPYFFQTLAPLALGFVKCSIVFFYRRIFRVGMGISDPFDLTTRIMLLIPALWSTALCLAFGFICGINFSRHWIPVMVAGLQRPNPMPMTIVYVISDAILDLILLILPIPLV